MSCFEGKSICRKSKLMVSWILRHQFITSCRGGISRFVNSIEYLLATSAAFHARMCLARPSIPSPAQPGKACLAAARAASASAAPQSEMVPATEPSFGFVTSMAVAVAPLHSLLIKEPENDVMAVACVARSDFGGTANAVAASSGEGVYTFRNSEVNQSFTQKAEVKIWETFVNKCVKIKQVRENYLLAINRM